MSITSAELQALGNQKAMEFLAIIWPIVEFMDVANEIARAKPAGFTKEGYLFGPDDAHATKGIAYYLGIHNRKDEGPLKVSLDANWTAQLARADHAIYDLLKKKSDPDAENLRQATVAGLKVYGAEYTPSYMLLLKAQAQDAYVAFKPDFGMSYNVAQKWNAFLKRIKDQAAANAGNVVIAATYPNYVQFVKDTSTKVIKEPKMTHGEPTTADLAAKFATRKAA
jgi:hypothetical protein